ncbi:Basic-leucine zipper (bZIP) transcription factor family protein [Euphorbia peplus]|nr:Basic-leucine zipper (bZIP) transcription factor family protein [Euphorbia peplus]
MDKGMKPSNGEEDDLLKLMLMDYDKQYPKPMIESSPCTPPTFMAPFSSPHENADTNLMLLASYAAENNVVLSNCSSTDSSNGADEAGVDQVCSKFLASGNPSSEPPRTQLADRDLESENQQPGADEHNEIAATPRPVIRPLRKAVSAETLARLTLYEPKKAKRIITNRMSAVRAKEKKKLYTFMLEHKLQTLQAEAATTNSRLTFLQTEGLGLSSENARLREEMDMVIRQIHFQDTLNEGIRSEVQNLRMVTRVGGNQQQAGQGMLPNNVNHNINNVGIDSRIATEHFFPAANYDMMNNDQFHNQLPNYPYHHQLQQLENGVGQMGFGTEYPWQLQQFPSTQLYQGGGEIVPQFFNHQLEAAAAGIEEIHPFAYPQLQDYGMN